MNTEFKKQNQISELPRLSPELMENAFKVYYDKSFGHYYNLLETIVFPQNLPPTFFDVYETQYNDTWPLISYKSYNTPNLWWIILLANNINNPTKKLEVGTELLIPTISTVKLILNEIS